MTCLVSSEDCALPGSRVTLTIADAAAATKAKLIILPFILFLLISL